MLVSNLFPELERWYTTANDEGVVPTTFAWSTLDYIKMELRQTNIKVRLEYFHDDQAQT